MAPFVIPGVSLEEVLGACKADRGRALYSLAAAAANDLAAYVRERRDDGDLELVELAGAPAADPPAAAGAPSPTSTVSRSTPPDGLPARWVNVDEVLEHNYRVVLTAFRDVDELAPRDVVARLELTANQALTALRLLLERGWLAHNGKLRNAARYRLTDTGRAELDARQAAAYPDEVLDPEQITDAPGAHPPAIIVGRANGSAELSPRVRRELEREERERRDREAAQAADRELPDGGTLEGRVTIALAKRLDRGATLPELANELRINAGQDLRDLAAVLRRLEDTDETHRAGRRNGHVIYVARHPALA